MFRGFYSLRNVFFVKNFPYIKIIFYCDGFYGKIFIL